MDVNIRKHIISNFKDVPSKEIEDTIVESLQEKDDLTLPGFGVFFELIWQESDKEMKEELLKMLKQAIKKESI